MKRDKDICEFVGNRIREIRLSIGISQEELGFRAEIDRTYISDVERGKRNVSLQNLAAISQALEVHISELFVVTLSKSRVFIPQDQNLYVINEKFQIDCGFIVTAQDILFATLQTSQHLEELPFSLYSNINLKSISGIIGSLFAQNLASKVKAVVNPIEKGHPDIIPQSGATATEEQLRNYPEGLEIKCTVGNVLKNSNINTGQCRLPHLTSITWQAHHREVESLMGMVIDFAGKNEDGKLYPCISGLFYSKDLNTNDWGQISGTTGRNTKVTGMTASGKQKMGKGWILLLNQEAFIAKYKKILFIPR